MRKIGLLLILLSFGAMAGEKARRAAPLIMLRMARQGYENMIWMEQRVKIGKQPVAGYIQATGGSDDAIMGFAFENDWDMLEATVGYKSTAPRGREAEFTVESPGQGVLYSSGILKSKGGSHKIRVPIRGHKRILLRISSEHYNGTAGAAWGQPTVLYGLSDEEMKNDWNLSINNTKTPLPGSAAPSKVLLPFDVPSGEVVEYKVRIRRDTEGRTVIVDKERQDS